VSTGFDRNRLELKSLSDRASRIRSGMLVGNWTPDSTVLEFVSSLPDVLAVRSMKTLAAALVSARKTGASRILMYGGHVIKCGLGPLLTRWIRDGLFSCLATNGAGTIHDLEMALFGETSEDVEKGIADGSFGMWKETGEVYASAVDRAQRTGTGLGEALGCELIERGAGSDISPLVAACEAGVPLTVHPALGSDIVHPCKGVSWERLAAAAERDFDLLGENIAALSGGVVMNVGSAVVMPEVFLKLLTTAINLGAEISGFTSANFDMIQHYRPVQNVLERPTRALNGTQLGITGHHELMLPLLDVFVRLEEANAD